MFSAGDGRHRRRRSPLLQPCIVLLACATICTLLHAVNAAKITQIRHPWDFNYDYYYKAAGLDTGRHKSDSAFGQMMSDNIATFRQKRAQILAQLPRFQRVTNAQPWPGYHYMPPFWVDASASPDISSWAKDVYSGVQNPAKGVDPYFNPFDSILLELPVDAENTDDISALSHPQQADVPQQLLQQIPLISNGDVRKLQNNFAVHSYAFTTQNPGVSKVQQNAINAAVQAEEEDFQGQHSLERLIDEEVRRQEALSSPQSSNFRVQQQQDDQQQQQQQQDDQQQQQQQQEEDGSQSQFAARYRQSSYNGGGAAVPPPFIAPSQALPPPLPSLEPPPEFTSV